MFCPGPISCLVLLFWATAFGNTPLRLCLITILKSPQLTTMRYSSINLAIALISLALISQVALCTLANGTSTITSYTEVTFTSTATAFIDTLGKPVKQPTSTTTARTKLNSIDVCDCNAAASSNWTQFALVLVSVHSVDMEAYSTLLRLRLLIHTY